MSLAFVTDVTPGAARHALVHSGRTVPCAGCERPQEPSHAAARQDVAPPVSEQKTTSAVPEHFDRVRAEQFEKEEERLRRSGR